MDKIKELTPIEFKNGYYFKRDDLFEFYGLHGAKVRAALFLIQKAINLGYTSVTTVGHRKSPQIHIVAELCDYFGLKFVGHTSKGELPTQFQNYNLIQHKPGYNNVLASRCSKYAKENNFFEIPFGMITGLETIKLTTHQFQDIPKEVKRIIVPVGSGVNLCGILHAVRNYKIQIPIIGIYVGKSPVQLLEDYGPWGWRRFVELIPSLQKYNASAKVTNFEGIELDPIYEAKCIPYIKEGDLFWVIGKRTF